MYEAPALGFTAIEIDCQTLGQEKNPIFLRGLGAQLYTNMTADRTKKGAATGAL